MQCCFTDVNVYCNKEGTLLQTTGILLGKVDCANTIQHVRHGQALVRPFCFQPYIQNQNHIISVDKKNDETAMSNKNMPLQIMTEGAPDEKTEIAQEHLNCITEAVWIAAENCQRNINVLLLGNNEHMMNVMEDIFHHDVTVWSNVKEQDDNISTRFYEIKDTDVVANSTDTFDLVIMPINSKQHKEAADTMGTLSTHVNKGGFVLVHDHSAGGFRNEKGLDESEFRLVFHKASPGNGFVHLYRTLPPRKPEKFIFISKNDF